ncbi:phytoene desaturase family protein [Spirosoma montaniterrae]|uniref:phytoene desaturase family protein n=1 Tax=Spirosoma montaniterrae TaxID=1178516 RepID=UPI00097D844E|nr:NAD(P)/FAD-dependent oxidoreductase [Spirosoma montaniterrae]
MHTHPDFDAVVVGSGPNGLAAAITLQHAGLSVLLLEAKKTVGGGMRTAELTLPGFRHDICSAIHPMGVNSPFFRQLPLSDFGLTYIEPPIAAAHPFDNGTAALLRHSILETAHGLGIDAEAYTRLVAPIRERWADIEASVLGPLTLHPRLLNIMSFGLKALMPAEWLANALFRGEAARGLFAGMAAHSLLPLNQLTTSAIGLVLMTQAHLKGWPMPKGGSQAIADALAGYFVSLGGKIETGIRVKSLRQLPLARAVLFDLTPTQLLNIAGHRLSALYRWQLKRYRHGAGVFKVDYALDGPVPFKNESCGHAGTVHVGGTLAEIAAAERAVARGQHPERPFVLLAQQSRFDPTRAPAGKHTAWAYCHVPNGSTVDMTAAIERQIERFAPGFRDRVLARHTLNTADLEHYNPNYRGGDINGGRADLTQLFTRPALRASPYRTSARGLYLCSSSTPPGGGVHGLCGYHAAQQALRDEFPAHFQLNNHDKHAPYALSRWPERTDDSGHRLARPV